MAKKDLKRMNRFELLELMYELVRENEKLRRKCERLEAGGAVQDENTGYSYTAGSRPVPEPEQRRFDEDEHYRTRREEVMQRMMEQTYQPAPTTSRHAAPPKAAGEKKTAAPARQAARQRAQTAESADIPLQPVKPARQAPQPKQEPVRRAPAAESRAQPKPRAAAPEDFDIDSILQEYLVDAGSARNGGRR